MLKWSQNCFFWKNSLCKVRVIFLGATSLRENGLQRPAKGGSTPAFAYQRAAIAPLPCPNLQPYCFMIQLYLNWTVLKNAIAAGKTCYKNNLLRKCGLLAQISERSICLCIAYSSPSLP